MTEVNGEKLYWATLATPDAVQALREAADNMLMGREGQPFHGAAVWLRRRADALAEYPTADQPPVCPDADDGQANDCQHLSASGVDTTPVSDPAKMWRCDHCGLRWAAGGPGKMHPCGHWDAVRGCGGCDPSAVDYEMGQPPVCPDHREAQHRDNKPPWCDSCGWRHGEPARRYGNGRVVA